MKSPATTTGPRVVAGVGDERPHLVEPLPPGHLRVGGQMQAVHAEPQAVDVDVGPDRDALHPAAPAEVGQEDLAVGQDAPADQHRVAEVLSAARVHRRRVVDVAQAEAAGDGVDARRIHLLERDHVGAAQVLVRADRGQRAVDVRRRSGC